MLPGKIELRKFYAQSSAEEVFYKTKVEQKRIKVARDFRERKGLFNKYETEKILVLGDALSRAFHVSVKNFVVLKIDLKEVTYV